ncbi:hypothetical protein BU24DRAFT_204411 [Aaosphaeria arxii CBS 175.79]|uniref:Uncharacterized protein n=1 Tax=Aaosphaeria arxii CBS 175.79 TaxID=1450172 RepID=A0A6A5XTD4_9PLEO|nr:uncharacterized protein BU24DRAFT_204411 [Aaosphaeria arxii CBS 175.79]KAF2016548.1 hypothetical protein BU24DRAFT_204411 [Aaosphaeria arxii CBS 175.79]
MTRQTLHFDEHARMSYPLPTLLSFLYESSVRSSSAICRGIYALGNYASSYRDSKSVGAPISLTKYDVRHAAIPSSSTWSSLIIAIVALCLITCFIQTTLIHHQRLSARKRRLHRGLQKFNILA